MSLVLIDGNHFGFWAAAADPRSNVGGVPTGGIQYFLKMIAQIRQDFGPNLFILWDGKSWRKERFASYKEGRTKSAQLVALKDQWKLQRPQVGKALQLLGLTQVIAANYEADDLARVMVNASGKKRVTLLTADKDWAQLYVQDRVRWVDLKNTRRIEGDQDFLEITGSPNTHQFVETKALCGDAGDSIPSVGNFGPKTAQELFAAYGSVFGAINSIVTGEPRPAGISGRLSRFLDSDDMQNAYRRNLDLVDLNSSAVPAPQGMRVIKQDRDEAELLLFCAQRSLWQATRFDEWLRPFKEKR